MPRLRRVDCSSPGIARRRRGRGFSYVDPSGAPVGDRASLERIRSLAIPPAWENVWICPLPNGHLQAVGTDAAGRRQYLYHPAWREHRDREKFAEMIAFAQTLPGMRRAIASHLRRDGLTRERVLAGAVALLDRGLFRVGGEVYAEENGSYGLATLERRHVRLAGERDGRLRLSGQDREAADAGSRRPRAAPARYRAEEDAAGVVPSSSRIATGAAGSMSTRRGSTRS